VLTRVDLDLAAGGLVRVGGYNGCGKSTLLRIIAGAHKPVRGSVTGRPGGVAYVPGQLPPLPFKAQDYLRHCGRIHGLSAAQTDERVLDWLERFEALGYRKHRIGDLSRGTAQKIAIIQALIAQPQLLILDEAWTSLDTAGQQTLDEAARQTAQRGGLVVFVDHDPQRLAEDVTAAYLLRDGIAHEAGAVDFELPLVVLDLENAPDPWPGPGRGRPLADGLLRMEVEPDASDGLLRDILAVHPDIHVVSVRTVDGRATRQGKQDAEVDRAAQGGGPPGADDGGERPAGAQGSVPAQPDARADERGTRPDPQQPTRRTSVPQQARRQP
jgi:ABC-type Mn2+/Zn2+ transport system ATPase subunit